MSESTLLMWKEMFLPRPETKYMFPSTIISRDLKGRVRGLARRKAPGFVFVEEPKILVVVGTCLEEEQRQEECEAEEAHSLGRLLGMTNEWNPVNDSRGLSDVGGRWSSLFINK
ncbi:hypothetical protein QR680_005302 [Steinernema hermaphroditum]|uniref:Uncharacterized protein n=1 Tax=Steinernema hermaphroditum TaxID=289476 RepID=A0AA39HSK3_9BILA|nr:hypothetical protein QR680_005302 [Steinernema hermaphroditum]